MKNLIKTSFTNPAKFLFLEGVKYSDESISEKIDKTKNPPEKKDPPISKLPTNEVNEMQKITNKERNEADSEIAFLDTDLLIGLESISPKLPNDIKEKVLEHLKESSALSTDELQNELNILLVANKTHLIITGTEKITVPVKIDEIWEATDKNPFPNGVDDIQKKLSQANPLNNAKGFITESGFEYYNNEGVKQVDSSVQLSDVIKDDLAPLSETNITSIKLHEIINSESFSQKNAQTIVQAMKTGKTSDVINLQKSFSNISPEFAKLVNGIDNKYGENTRKGVRTLAIALSKLITESTKTVVTYKTKIVKKWLINKNTNVKSGFGSHVDKGFEFDESVVSQLKVRQELEEKSLMGNDNTLQITPIYTETSAHGRIISRDTGVTILYKKGEQKIIPTPVILTNEITSNQKIISNINNKLEARKKKS